MMLHWFDFAWLGGSVFLMGFGIGGWFASRTIRWESYRSAPIQHDESPWVRR